MRRSYWSGVSWLSFTRLQWSQAGANFAPAPDVENPIGLAHVIQPDVHYNYSVVSVASPYIVATFTGGSTFDNPGTAAIGRYYPQYVSLEPFKGALSGDVIIAVASCSAAGTFGIFSAGKGSLAYPGQWTEPVASSGLTIQYLTLTSAGVPEFALLDQKNGSYAWAFFLVRGLAAVTAEGVQGGGLNPASLAPSWGATARTLWLAAAKGTILAPTAPVGFTSPSGYADLGAIFSNSGTANNQTALGVCYKTTTAASDDPATFVYSGASGSAPGYIFLAFKASAATDTTVSASAGGLTLLPSTLTNTQTFQTQSLRFTLKPTALTNAQVFQTQSIRVTLKPAVLTNTQTFQVPKVNRTVKPSVYSNGQTFFAPTVSVAAANKVPPLHTNTQSFFSPSIRLTLKPALATNSQTFQSPKLIRVLKPTNQVNSQAFFTQSLKVTLKPLSFSNTQGFFTHSLRVTLKSSLGTNSQAFFAPTLTFGSANKVPPLHTNSQTFFTQTLRMTLKPVALTNSSTYASPRLVLTLKPTNLINSQVFPSPKLIIKLSPAAYTNSQNFYGPTVAIAGKILPGLFLNTQTFYGPTVQSGVRVGGGYYDESPVRKKRVIPHPDQFFVPEDSPPEAKKKARKKQNQAVVSFLKSSPAPTPLPPVPVLGNVRSVTAEFLDAWFEGNLKAEIAAEKQLLSLAEISLADFQQSESLAAEALMGLMPEGERLNESRKAEEEFLIQMAWSTYFDS